jgi:hypothetical protein
VGKYKWEKHGLGWPRHKARPHLKNSQQKKAGVVTQVIEYQLILDHFKRYRKLWKMEYEKPMRT